MQAIEIKIEKGHPIPEGRKGGEINRLRVAIKSMRRGDSFLYSSAFQHVYAAARDVNAKVATRKTEDGKLRVWRVK